MLIDPERKQQIFPFWLSLADPEFRVAANRNWFPAGARGCLASGRCAWKCISVAGLDITTFHKDTGPKEKERVSKYSLRAFAPVKSNAGRAEEQRVNMTHLCLLPASMITIRSCYTTARTAHLHTRPTRIHYRTHTHNSHQAAPSSCNTIEPASISFQFIKQLCFSSEEDSCDLLFICCLITFQERKIIIYRYHKL